MRIIVCIKQVPVLAAMQFDAGSRRLKRDGVPLEVSSFDVRALVKAVEVARSRGGEVVALTMGPPQARQALEECLALGADRAIHLCDPLFAGSDTLATARTLAAAVRRESFDLVLCGRNSVDAETGQVGPELAEMLRLPQVTSARSLEIDASGSVARLERETDEGFESVECALPLLVTAGEDLAPERFPSKGEREQAKQRNIETLRANDLAIEHHLVGAEGSPTVVLGLEIVENRRMGQVLNANDGDTIEDAIERLAARLVDKGLFTEWRNSEPAAPRTREPVSRTAARDVWVLAEILDRRPRKVTFELLGKGRELARQLDSRLSVLLLGQDVAGLADEVAHSGADQVLLADDVRLADYDTDYYSAVVTDAVVVRSPGILLVPSTLRGRDLAPRIAARLGAGLTGDCIDLDLDREGRLVQYKPAFGGSVVAPIISKTLPEMATIRPGFFDAAATNLSSTPARVERLPVPNTIPRRIHVTSKRQLADAPTALDAATVVIGVGKGLGSAERLSVVDPLARLLDAAICTTRDVADAGWLPRQYQVGLTGRTVSPRLYIAVGIRGAMEHMVGVRRADLIVAINKNPKAPIFKASDCGIVGDFAQVVPALVERLTRARQRGAP
jgi:electron transfer flavoprotein alpha subunit